MQSNQFPEYDVGDGNLARPLRHVTEADDEAYGDATATDPLASDAPLCRESQWPSSDELETAMLEADPFEMIDGPGTLTGEIAELFGELEPPLPRDTLPSPPPGQDERPGPDNGLLKSQLRRG